MYEKIKELCRFRKITIAELEQAAGLGTRTIYRWDTNSPSFEKVLAVADFLQVSLDELAGREHNGVEPVILSKNENVLLANFRELNTEGQSDVLKYTYTLLRSGLYIKRDFATSTVGA